MSEATSEYVLIPVGNGKFAKVDQEDADMARKKWRLSAYSGANRDFAYAVRITKLKSGGRRTVFMHVEVAKRAGIYRPRLSVNHSNGDWLDNRRGNLRVASSHDHQGTRGASINNKSGYKGVFGVPGGKWRARIVYLGKAMHLGRFDSIVDAAVAYDRAALAAFGEFASTNYPAFAVGHASRGNKESQKLARIAEIRKASSRAKAAGAT